MFIFNISLTADFKIDLTLFILIGVDMQMQQLPIQF